ncbi:MAG: DUF4446 family protein [Clostridia bacterium]|nr:DUF4446 family protein [Clostridia bacterium]
MIEFFSNTTNVIYALVLADILLLIILIAVIRVTLYNNRKLKRILKNCSTGKLDETIVLYYNKLDELTQDIHATLEDFKKLERINDAGRMKIGYLRYDAFDTMSNELSYSFAILDEKDSGFVVSGIFGRDISNTYLKPVVQGKSTITLSEEEERAISYAQQNYQSKLN